jgi:hypothetical protein
MLDFCLERLPKFQWSVIVECGHRNVALASRVVNFEDLLHATFGNKLSSFVAIGNL